MAKATTYTFQGREWTVKDLAEELDLSTHRVYRLLKDHNEDINAIFESRGKAIIDNDKSQRTRLIEYKGKQWTVKQLAEEFGLSSARVNHLIRQYDGDMEQIFELREKNPKIYLPKPDKSQISLYSKLWRDNDKLQTHHNTLKLLFSKWPLNDNLDCVLLKVSTLNSLYSTNIFDTFGMANHILACNIDKDLSDSDKNVVDRIADITINKKKKYFFSFASKYCNYHFPEEYPIYDYFVEKMLLYFRDKDDFDDFKKIDLKKYSKFIDVINNFKSFYKLSSFSMKEIDTYLWLAGKEYFPKNYKKGIKNG